MSTNMLLSPDALHCLKRKQLTNLCRRFGIKAVGKNSDLIQRLQEYAASNIPTNSPTKGNVAILRHVKRPRQSDDSSDSDNDNHHPGPRSTSSLPPLTPRTRQKRVSDLVQAIQEVKAQPDEVDSDDELDEVEGISPSRKNTIAFPAKQEASPLDPGAMSPNSTQPLRIIKALPSSNRLASPLSTASILELSRPSMAHQASAAASSLYPDITTLPLPEGVSSDCLASSSTLPSITSRQFSAAAASVLAEMNARLTAAGRSATSASLATMSSMGNGAWQALASSTSTQGMSKSRSGRYEIHHERQFNKMDSIVNHYAARRVGAPSNETPDASASPSSDSVSATTKTVAVARRPQRVDASTSTRSLAAMVHSTSTRKMPVQRRPLPVPPVSQARTTAPPPASARASKPPSSRQPSGSEAPQTKRLRLAVTEEQGALQNTVLEIPPEKKSVMIRVTRPERDGLPFQVSVAPASPTSSASGPVRAASSLRKSVIKATKSTFSSSSAKKTTATAQTHRREAAFVKQQQHQAAMSRSLSSRANLDVRNPTEGIKPSASVRNKFTGTHTSIAPPASSSGRVGAVAASESVAASVVTSEAAKTGSVSRLGGSFRSSVSQGLGRAEAARQARLKEIKARTKAALSGFGSARNVADTPTPTSPRKGATFSPSVTRPTIASLNRAVTGGSASLPMLSAITAPLCGIKGLDGLVVDGLQRAATVHAGVGALMPCLTPRSSSLRHLRRVMRKQQKQADLEHERLAAAENIAPGAVVPSVIKPSSREHDEVEAQGPSIRTVARAQAKVTQDKYTTLPSKTRAAGRPVGPRSALVASRATTSALNRI